MFPHASLVGWPMAPMGTLGGGYEAASPIVMPKKLAASPPEFPPGGGEIEEEPPPQPARDNRQNNVSPRFISKFSHTFIIADSVRGLASLGAADYGPFSTLCPLSDN